MEALLLPILLIAVFYFLLIRPQQRQKRQMQHMQQTLMVGSKVMTGAGLLGTVVEIDEDNDQVVLEVAPGVTNRYVRRAIVNILESPDAPESEIADTPEELLGASDELRDASESARAEKPAEHTEAADTESRDRANDGETR